jgi:hypothetical protein
MYALRHKKEHFELLSTVQVKDSTTGQPIKDVTLQVKAIALEHGLTVFAYKGIPNAEGKLTWLE